MPAKLDLMNKTFGYLTVIEPAESRNGNCRWLCICKCGKRATIRANNLKSGETKSCGCLQAEVTSARLTKHGHAKRTNRTKEFIAWMSMRNRCSNASNPEYRNYGGRGVSVCSQWEESFQTFLQDIGRAPTKKHSIDRIDVNGNYTPENCVWATATQQCRNMRKTVFITAFGETRTLMEWAGITGIKRNIIYNRLSRGWCAENALNPNKHRRKKSVVYSVNGETKTVSELARDLRIPANTIYTRLSRGWTIEESIKT